ncbi:MAG TPA: zf-HC2 domain-containing protein [Fibrobacteria bacterium]|nr:zf-HC2 domain-containing protein [Fibrobacteria bacterium]
MKPLPASAGPAGPHPSRLSISAYLAGETAAADRAAFEAHLAACPDCAALVRDARSARDAFAAQYPSLEHLGATRRAKRNPAPVTEVLLKRLRALFAGPAWRPVFAAAALLALAAVVLRLPFRPAPSDDLSPKGTARFVLFVDGRPVTDDSIACKPGDTLQLGIVSNRPVHYAVLYRDDGGPLKTYMADGQGEPRGGPKGENLPYSLVLDSGWRRERLYCLWSAGPFDAHAARAFIEGGGEAAAEGDAFLHLRTFLILNSP